MPTFGPWLEDAAEVERWVVINWGASGSIVLATDSWGWDSRDGTDGDTGLNRITRAWDLSGFEPDPSEPIDGPRGNVQTSAIEATDDPFGGASWQAMWLTVQRPDPADLLPVNSSTVPEFDPAAVDVEWEPTTDIIGQRIEIIADTEDMFNFGDRPFDVKLVDGLAGRYEPGIETAATMSARSSVAQISGTTTTAAVLNETDPDWLTLGGTDSFAVALLDYWSANQTLDGFPVELSPSLTYHPLIQLHYRFRPRYRFIYPDATAAVSTSRVTPSLRMLQRGGAGGMSGIPRMIGDPTRRGSVRQGPGSIV